MGGLTEAEKAMAWDACFHYSPAGIAIVEKDGTFRMVNPAFYKMLDVTPAQLLGKRYQDITTSDTIRLDELNAKLVIDGQMDTYTLPKGYDFGNGYIPRKVKLTVGRAPTSDKGDFLFFVAQIILDDELPIPTIIPVKMTPRPNFFAELGKAIRWGMENYKITVTAVIGFCTIMFYLIEKFYPSAVK